MRKILKNDKGFSLVELLAVVCILAILVSIALPVVSKYLDSSRRETLIDNSLAAISAVKSNMIMEGYNNKVYTIDEINNILDKKLYDSSFSGNSKFVGLGKGEVYSDDYEGSMIVASRELVDADTNKYKYEFKMCLYDEDGRGFYLTDEKKLDSSVVMLEGVTSCSKTAADQIISTVGDAGGIVKVEPVEFIVNSSDDNKIIEYRYVGSSDAVNNYVYFNCNDINNQSVSTCELYRIIGVFSVDNGTGKFEDRVKLIKAESYGNLKWDNAGINNWARPSTLNSTFNTTYFNAISANYQNLIGNSKYYLGGCNQANLNIKVDLMYQNERAESGSSYYYGSNPNSWVGKIALMYTSDYGFAAGSSCYLNKTLSFYHEDGCASNNWLYLGGDEWLLSQHSSYDFVSHCISNVGAVGFTGSGGNAIKVRPVFYLNSNVSFVGGDGSIDNPYRLF